MFLTVVSRHWSQGLVSIAVFYVSCTSVPPQAVMLSEAVGQRIAAVQSSHERLVKAYFDLSRNQVEDFMQRQWIPQFLSMFVSRTDLIGTLENPTTLTPELQDRIKTEINRRIVLDNEDQIQVMQAINSGLGDNERGQIILDFAQAALEQIELQRQALINPINSQEQKVVMELRANYSELNQMQSIVTAHLQSIKEVNEVQDQILNRLNLLDTRDQLIESAINLNEKVIRLTESGEEATKVVEQIKELLHKENDD